jgi:spermidine/putrescine transport system substrate-binding protein
VGSKEVMEYMSESAQEAGFEEPMDYRYFFGDGAESIVMDPVMYPDSEVISRCAMMHDSGDRTEVLLEMWSRIKGDSLNTGMLSIIFITLGLLLFLGIYRKVKRARLRRQYLN